MTRQRFVLLCLLGFLAAGAKADPPRPQPISPRDGPLPLFNGQDFRGLYTFLKGPGVRRGPDDVFRVQDGMIHVSGEGRGYIATEHEYRNYPLIQEKLDTRGKQDVASLMGEWTRVEVVCRGDRVTVKINGVTVNEALDVTPTHGKILLQNEGSEIYYRNWQLLPLEE